MAQEVKIYDEIEYRGGMVGSWGRRQEGTWRPHMF